LGEYKVVFTTDSSEQYGLTSNILIKRKIKFHEEKDQSSKLLIVD
jgi:hypothetical protein